MAVESNPPVQDSATDILSFFLFNFLIMLLIFDIKEYKIPLINNISSGTLRIFKGIDKPSTAAYSECYYLNINSKEVYLNEKDKIFGLLNKSYNIAKNHWDKRLLIDVRKGNIKSAIFNIDNDLDQTESWAYKLLSDDYTYEV